MGMAASQGRLLALTSRNLDIGRQLSSLSMQKMCLTREMRKISLEYNDALSTKSLKLTNNGGASYVDLTYSNLMAPNAMNQYKNYLITDTSGKVVVDYNYKKYAEMISPEGKPCGTWSGDTRIQILSELTGLDKDVIENHDTLLNECIQKEYDVFALENEEPQPSDYKCMDTETCLKKTGLISGQEYPASTLQSAFATLAQYTGGNSGKYNEIVGAVAQSIIAETFSYDSFANQVLSEYQSAVGTSQAVWWEPGEYEKYQQEHAEWKNKFNPAYEDYEKSMNAYDAQYTKDQERMIEYYDTLFSSIADQGWTYNESVTDKEYLNQMLQNNLYTITIPNHETKYNEKTKQCESFNTYDTTLASNFGNVVAVNDSDVSEKAMAEYQYKKSVINEKESRIDTRMDNLKTEQAAIKQMIEGIEKVKDDNTERTFSTFG